MKRIKTLVALSLVSVLSLSIFTGCGKNESTTTGDSKDEDKPVEITWWNYPNYDTIDNTPGKFEQQII